MENNNNNKLFIFLKVQVSFSFSWNQWHCECGWQPCGATVQACFPTSPGPMPFICWVTMEGLSLLIIVCPYFGWIFNLILSNGGSRSLYVVCARLFLSLCLNSKASGYLVFCLTDLHFQVKRRWWKMLKLSTHHLKLLACLSDILITWVVVR